MSGFPDRLLAALDALLTRRYGRRAVVEKETVEPVPDAEVERLRKIIGEEA